MKNLRCFLEICLSKNWRLDYYTLSVLINAEFNSWASLPMRDCLLSTWCYTHKTMYVYCMWQESQDHSDLYTTSNQILEVANSLDQGYWYTVCRYISTKFSADYKHSVVRVHLSWCLWNLLFECSNDVKKAAANPGPSQEQKVKKIKATGGVQLVIGSKKSPVKKTPPEAAPEVITPPPPLFT